MAHHATRHQEECFSPWDTEMPSVVPRPSGEKPRTQGLLAAWALAAPLPLIAKELIILHKWVTPSDLNTFRSLSLSGI